jgi:hypothetical protein
MVLKTRSHYWTPNIGNLLAKKLDHRFEGNSKGNGPKAENHIWTPEMDHNAIQFFVGYNRRNLVKLAEKIITNENDPH